MPHLNDLIARGSVRQHGKPKIFGRLLHGFWVWNIRVGDQGTKDNWFD